MEFLVAVAVTASPTGTSWESTKLKEALPWRLVLTVFWPMNFLPSISVPLGLEKNWMVKLFFLCLVLGVLLSVPVMAVVPEEA